jgi:uncharacterized membrane protein
MGKTIASYLIVLATMGIFDFLWLGIMSKNFYKQHLGFLMAGKVNWGAAAAFYLLYAAGVTYFFVLPAIAGELSLGQAVLQAAIFGLIAYATYDLSNWATLKGWPAIVVFVDIAWGVLFTSATVWLSIWVNHFFRF